MQTVVEAPGYITAAKAAGITDAVRAEIVAAVAVNPQLGDLVVGSGGLRKFRFGRAGGGKSGGFRILCAYFGEDLPVFLIGAFSKNQKDNITAAEKAELGKRLRTMAANYRKARR